MFSCRLVRQRNPKKKYAAGFGSPRLRFGVSMLRVEGCIGANLAGGLVGGSQEYCAAQLCTQLVAR
jgi:hypothetical protein